MTHSISLYLILIDKDSDKDGDKRLDVDSVSDND